MSVRDELQTVHVAVEFALEQLAAGVTVGADAATALTLREYHAALENRVAELEAENAALTNQNAMLLVDQDENRRLRADLAAANRALTLRRRGPADKTVELERDGTGAVVRARIFNGGS